MRDNFPATLITGEINLYTYLYIWNVYFKLTVKYMSIYTEFYKVAKVRKLFQYPPKFYSREL